MKKVLLLMLLSFILLSCTRTDAPAADPNAPLVALGNAPEFELQNLAGGQLNSADLKGKVVIVDFWATWCVPCLQEIPNYNALYEENEGKDVELVGLTVQSGSFEDVQEALPDLGINYPIVMGNDDVEKGFGGVWAIPTTFVIGKDWKVYKKILGNVAGKKETLAQAVTLLLEKEDTVE